MLSQKQFTICHVTIPLEDSSNRVCAVVPCLCAVASCIRVTLAFSSATLFIMLLFALLCLQSFSLSSCSQMCWLLLFIPVPVALLSPQLADMQLTWVFASVEVHWSVKERPQEDSAGFLRAPCSLSASTSTGLVSAGAHQHSSC